MTGVADAPDASQKLRLVLDYLPCEACLAQPVKDQELLCSICHRLHRQVAVRVTTNTAVILERPNLPPAAAEVVIPPAAPAPVEPEAPAVEIITEPYEEPAPTPMAADAQDEPLEAPAPKRRFGFFRREEKAPEPEPVFESEVGFEPTDDLFEVARGEPVIADEGYEVAREEPAMPPALAQPEPEVLSEAEPESESDFVFRAPEEAQPAPPVEEVFEEPAPVEEIILEPEEPAPSPWAPPEEIFADEPQPPHEPEPEPEPAPAREAEPVEEVVEMEVLPEEPAPAPVEEEVLEATLVEDEVVPAEIVEEESIPASVPPPPLEPPAPSPGSPSADSDLYRLRDFSVPHHDALAKLGIDSLASLAGHDPHDLAARSGVDATLLVGWVHVADLVHEVGVPIDSAIALVAAGVAGPRGLRDLPEQEILDRVESTGGVRLSGRDVKRWKRRA